jgi:hypothetical protein
MSVTHDAEPPSSVLPVSLSNRAEKFSNYRQIAISDGFSNANQLKLR